MVGEFNKFRDMNSSSVSPHQIAGRVLVSVDQCLHSFERFSS